MLLKFYEEGSVLQVTANEAVYDNI